MSKATKTEPAKEPKEKPAPYEPSDAEISAKLREAAGGLTKAQAIQVLKNQRAHDEAQGLS